MNTETIQHQETLSNTETSSNTEMKSNIEMPSQTSKIMASIKQSINTLLNNSNTWNIIYLITLILVIRLLFQFEIFNQNIINTLMVILFVMLIIISYYVILLLSANNEKNKNNAKNKNKKIEIAKN